MWVINIQHWLDETMSGPAVPQLGLKVKKISEVITYATSVARRNTNGIDPEMLAQTKKKTL